MYTMNIWRRKDPMSCSLPVPYRAVVALVALLVLPLAVEACRAVEAGDAQRVVSPALRGDQRRVAQTAAERI